MDERLLGYLLEALDPAEQQQAEAELAADPQAKERLALLRRAVAPLAHDKDGVEPPPTLITDTLCRVAEYLCQPGTPSPFPKPAEPEAPTSPRPSDPELAPPDWVRDMPTTPAATSASARRKSRRGLPPGLDAVDGPTTSPPLWRRWDVAIALCLLIVVGGVTWPAVNYLRSGGTRAECQDNLRKFYGAFDAYARIHDGYLPAVADRPPHHTAGAYIPLLGDEGYLPAELSLQCPTHGRMKPVYGQPAPPAAYAFALGYRDGANGPNLFGIRKGTDDPDEDGLPVLADLPPDASASEDSPPFPPSHVGGQNVLYLGGHVQFCTTPLAGINRDNIYRNQGNKVAAGWHRTDTVLGTSREQP